MRKTTFRQGEIHVQVSIRKLPSPPGESLADRRGNIKWKGSITKHTTKHKRF